MLRRYRSLRTQGYGVRDKCVLYKPFKLILSFREAPQQFTDHSNSVMSTDITMLLLITATPVTSAYKCIV